MAIVLSTRSRRSDFEVFRSRNAEFVDELATLRKYRKARLANLAALSRRSKRSKVRDLLTDNRLLRLYAYEALRKSGNLREATGRSVGELAAGANLFRPCRENSPMRPVRSRSRFRYVFSFGPQKRLRQLLVADVVRALHPPRLSQKLFNGGMPAARRAVEAAFLNGGMRYCVEVDLVDFYGSIPLEGLADVLRPLPAGAVRHVVYDLTIRHSEGDDCPTGTSAFEGSDPHRIGQVGLALGSACSAAVGECILAQFLRQIPDGHFVAYADNILLLGQTAEEAQVLTDSLEEALQNGIGAMRFRVRTTPVIDIECGFDFLGQQVTVSNDGTRLTWRPTFDKIAEYLIGDWPIQANAFETDEAEAKLINWRTAYPEWPEGEATEARGLAEIASVRYFQSRSAVDRRRAISAILDALQANGYLLGIDEIVPDIGPSHTASRERLIQACVNRFSRAGEANHAGM